MAFVNNLYLTDIEIPDSVTSIAKGAFDCCGLKDIHVSPENPNYASIDGVLYSKDLKEIIKFPERKDVLDYLIPDSVTSIAPGAFGSLCSLQHFNVSPANPCFVSVDGVLYSKDLKEIIRYPKGKDMSEYRIPDSVTSIADYAFCDCESLKSIDIPNSVTAIGNEAFVGCI